jgi:AcrR family transcriptional regulator
MTTRQLTKKGRERRRQLMDYATQRFAEYGYHPTSIDDLVNGIGVGKGVFYWYFPSKERLLVEILEDNGADLRRAQREAIGDATDPVESLRLGLRATMRWLVNHQNAFNLFKFAATQESLAEVLRTENELALIDAINLVKRFKRAETGLPAKVTANAVLGVSNQLAQSMLIDQGQSPDVVADAALQFCLNGLLGRGDAAKEQNGGGRRKPR